MYIKKEKDTIREKDAMMKYNPKSVVLVVVVPA